MDPTTAFCWQASQYMPNSCYCPASHLIIIRSGIERRLAGGGAQEPEERGARTAGAGAKKSAERGARASNPGTKLQTRTSSAHMLANLEEVLLCILEYWDKTIKAPTLAELTLPELNLLPHPTQEYKYNVSCFRMILLVYAACLIKTLTCAGVDALWKNVSDGDVKTLSDNLKYVVGVQHVQDLESYPEPLTISPR